MAVPARRLLAVACTLAVLVGVPATGVVAGEAEPTPTATPDRAGDPGQLHDPYRSQQWYLDRIGLTADRPAPTGDGQVVAVVDSGVDLEHPDLVDALARRGDGSVLGRDFVEGDDVPQDRFGHGTMVAGVVAATAGNGVGTRGVAPGARLMPLRVLDERGVGTTASIADAIDFAVDNGATVVNLSLEAATRIAVQDVAAVVAAIDRAVASGVAVVAAAGNQHERLQDFDPDLEVLVVGATDRDDRRAGFSDAGRTDLLMAPGVQVVSSWCRVPQVPVCDGTVHNQGIADGTSFAAPQASGAIALLMEAGLTAEQAVERLVVTAEDLGPRGDDAATGVGLLDVDAALGPWPDGPVPLATRVESTAQPTVSEQPAVASPEAIAVATPPTSTRVVSWVVVAMIVVVILLVVQGILAHRRVRPLGTMPDLRDR